MDQQDWRRPPKDFNKGPIQVRVPTAERIFNPMDPSPMAERSLNPSVADWIEEWAEDLDGDSVELEVLVADGSGRDKQQVIVDGLRSHFEYREWSADRRLSELLRDGLFSLTVGLACLIGFTTASRLISVGQNAVLDVIHEGMLVVGWVSMWKPIGIFLYEQWPLRRERKAYQRLRAAEITFP